MSGDHQDTSEKPSGKKAKKINQKEQSERFKATARMIEADESGESFDALVNTILRAPKP